MRSDEISEHTSGKHADTIILGDHGLTLCIQKFSESKPGIRTPPPTLGQHTDEILRGTLGMTTGDIENLRGEGVVA